MDNRFVFLIGSYNNEKWVSQNLESILSQTHKNFKIVYYNAASSDKTYEIAKTYADKDSRINLITTPDRHMKTWFLEHLYDYETIEDNDVVCILDGDDFLANEEVLDYLNEAYNKTNCWITYGGMIVWYGGSSTQEPYPQNSESPFEVKEKKLYRQDLWRYSHFRTYRGFLWKRINQSEWKSKHDNQYIMVEDLVSMYSCLEMCPSNKIYRIDQTVYIWNSSNSNGGSRGCTENKVNNIGQLHDIEVRSRPKYAELSVVSPNLAGGLGNQMFEIAAAASLAKDNNAQLLINPTEHVLPNQGRNINTYLDNVFNKIATDNAPPIKTDYTWGHITYKQIPYQPNIKINGHFASYRYFDHNREYIQTLFSPTTTVKNRILNIYGSNMENITAIQVRRGDYIKFPDHHPLLSAEYYTNAVKLVNPTEIWIFSDSIDWCKENLHFDCTIKYIKDEDYIEMYLLSLCKNVIIANSSFGWWAAYLNKRNDKKIYAPSHWFGKSIIDDGFKICDLALPEWILI
jgi:glycosyltransferase involved in cell wall biosynthesis